MADTHRSTLVGVFSDPKEAQAAVADLKAAGFAGEQIGVAGHVQPGSPPALASQATTPELAVDKRIGEGTATGAAVGASLGVLWGIGIAAGLLPAVGAVFVGGTLMALLASAGGGAVLGSLIGALIALGVPQDEAAYYEQEFRSGSVLVTVQTADRADLVQQILTRHGAYNHVKSAQNPTVGAPPSTPPTPEV